MIDEAMKKLALDEFGTLEGVEIQYWVNPQTGCIRSARPCSRKQI